MAESSPKPARKTVDLDWPENWPTAEVGVLPTTSLPDEVVGKEFVVGIWSYTPDPEQPRRGTVLFGLRFAGEENPVLSPDEAIYVAEVLRRQADRLVATAKLAAVLQRPFKCAVVACENDAEPTLYALTETEQVRLCGRCRDLIEHPVYRTPAGSYADRLRPGPIGIE